MGCLDSPAVLAMFERSNIPREQWPIRAAHIDEASKTEGLPPSDLDEVSLVEVHLKPDGSSMGTEEHMLGVVPGGLVLLREVGGFLKARKVDLQSMLFSELPGI